VRRGSGRLLPITAEARNIFPTWVFLTSELGGSKTERIANVQVMILCEFYKGYTQSPTLNPMPPSINAS